MRRTRTGSQITQYSLRHTAPYRALQRTEFASGDIAGASSLLFLYSLDYARTRLANDNKSAKKRGDRQFNGLIDVYKKTLATDGFAGLYRGFVISCVGIVVYRLYFGLYNSMYVLTGDLANKFLASFLLGWSVTIGVGLASYPVDTIRRRMMMTSGWPRPANQGTLPCPQNGVFGRAVEMGKTRLGLALQRLGVTDEGSEEKTSRACVRAPPREHHRARWRKIRKTLCWRISMSVSTPWTHPLSKRAQPPSILTSLGFSDERMNYKTKDLSGGWRMRVALARALFVKHTMLLLDEQNHLDLGAYFMNNVCTNIIELTPKKQLGYYTGNYDTRVKTKSELETNQMKAYEKSTAVTQPQSST
ncbi:hypothetical protein HK104_003787 [Borealophlyctis nickersoniae]|nr:hypothetical protein HK104_003787 [Borealophlyctis nickersoniae]